MYPKLETIKLFSTNRVLFLVLIEHFKIEIIFELITTKNFSLLKNKFFLQYSILDMLHQQLYT